MKMKEEEKIEPYYQNNAKVIVDTLFESKTFNEKMTRDDLKSVEDYLAFYLQTTAKSAKKITELSIRFRKF